MWPQFADLEYTHQWRGLVCFALNYRPSIGRMPEDSSVYFGYGYHGNGVNSATWSGREVVEHGEADAYGHRKKVDVGEALAAEIKAKTGFGTMSSDLTYDLRDNLIFITSPTSVHALAQSALAHGVRPLLHDDEEGRR